MVWPVKAPLASSETVLVRKRKSSRKRRRAQVATFRKFEYHTRAAFISEIDNGALRPGMGVENVQITGMQVFQVEGLWCVNLRI